MAIRDHDTSLWLHNKLGTSNDSWISGSIVSQLNKEVLRNIKECFPDLQTQVKLKLLLSFFHIPRRLVEEWKTELEEIIEVAGLDSELWVSMLSETMKTFAATGSLNTEISDYEETRPIFTDMVNELRKLVSKHSDLGMLPLECQYLNKNALISVVGQQQNPVKHFTLKRKPKSVNLRTELLQKSADAQSSLKKASAPTIPLRSRGMPRKMTDTTPLKGIPSRVPTTGFRSPTSTANQHRPNMSRTPAGRKDGGIKVIDITEQPLGYAAQKKRKRQLELEEQQKKAAEQKQAAAAVASAASELSPAASAVVTPTTPTSSTPDYAAGLASTSIYAQPPTPAVTTTIIKEEPIDKKPLIIVSSQNNIPILSTTQLNSSPQQQIQTTNTTTAVTVNTNKRKFKEEEIIIKTEPEQQVMTNDSIIKIEKIEKIEPKIEVPAIKSPPQVMRTLNNIVTIPNNISVKITQSPSNKAVNNNNSVKVTQPSQVRKQTIVSSTAAQTQTTPQTRTIPLSQLPKPGGAPLIISQTIIKPRAPASTQQQPQQQTLQQSTQQIQQPQQTQQILRNSSGQQIIVSSNQPLQTQQITLGGSQAQPPQQQQTQYILTSTTTTMPSLTSFAQARPSHTIIQTPALQASGASQPTKILLKTAPTLPTVMMTSTSRSNNVQSQPPPLISTQQPTILNIQNVNLPNRAVTIQPASQAAQVQHIQAQLQAQQQQQQQQQAQQVQIQQTQPIQTHTVVSNTNATQQPKFTIMSSKNINSPGKTIYLAQKGVILRNIGGDMYQHIPISSVSGLNNLSGATLVTTNTGGPPGLVKTTNTIQQPAKQATQIPALIPTNNLTQSTVPVVIASQQPQPQQTQTVQTIIGNPPQQTIIRPVLSNVQGNITTLPQGITLIQRPGQQPQLVQVQQTNQQQPQTQQIQRIITTTQPQQTQQAINRPQQIIFQQRPQTIISTQPQQQTQQQPQQRQVQVQRQQPTQIVQQQVQVQQQPVRRGLALSNEHVTKAHEMFRKANKVSRPDKALILGFMAGMRDNPRPNAENVIVIKLGETEEKVSQDDGTSASCLVESLIRLDYNTGEWKTFQNYRRLDQNQQDNKMQQSQANSVII
ncbi:negative elongation factor A [Condylostylus longicornis]|uniref:negative elongation factor A n=1 Tax=Condylostylus longicornis TaxID=2530218 RepID=UPI00244E3A3D|nr:negative elongation factor A [Condylostylus longicornis]